MIIVYADDAEVKFDVFCEQYIIILNRSVVYWRQSVVRK